MRYRVRLRRTAIQYTTVEVEAISEDAAWDSAEDLGTNNPGLLWRTDENMEVVVDETPTVIEG